jgi:hypothetical protein
VYCSGPEGAIAQIEMCGQCAETSAGTSETRCPAGYRPLADQPGVCQFQGQAGLATGNCPPGFRHSPADLQRCEMVYEQFTSCPSDYVLDPSGSQCRQAQLAPGSRDCGVGQYFDEGARACVSAPLARAGCMEGFTLNLNLQCCRAEQENTYPTCKPGEVWSDFAGCVPMVVDESAKHCSTAFLDVGFCVEAGGSGGESGGGDSGGSGSGNENDSGGGPVDGPIGCAPQACSPPRSWDAENCCCSHPSKGCE